jgi:hypothetical protein
MTQQKQNELSSIRQVGERLVESCHDAAAFRAVLDQLKPREVLEAQVFIWDFLHRLSEERGIPLHRQEITARMTPTSTYQYSVGCNERLDYCRANICVYTNPVCASNKLRGQMEALRQILSKLLA